MPRKTLFLIIGLIVVTIVLFIIALRTGDQTKDQTMQIKPAIKLSPTPFAFTTLTLSPNPVEVSPGKQGVVDVMIDTESNEVTGVQLELVYDPLMVTNVKIAPTELVKNPLVLIDKNDPKTGRITYAFGPQPKQPNVKGVGSIATITFTTRGKTGSQSYLTLLPTTLVTAQGIADSVLKTSNSAVVNIVAVSTPSAPISPSQ